MKNYLQINDKQLVFFEKLYQRYHELHLSPETCRPMIIVNTPVDNLPVWEERLADPEVMLRAELDSLRPHLELGDDRVPTVRVQFGTAQIAAAFGCEMYFPPNNLPAAKNHVLTHAEDVYQLALPELDAGWYGKLFEWTKMWLEVLPNGVHIQHPDIQSTFNSAHLIRGNDIFTDFFENPNELKILLDRVTDFMINITLYTKGMISSDSEWFFDWGALWKGAARISNCSMHMISPQFYRDFVFQRDIRFFEAVGGGRMHYCGTADEVIDDFFKVPNIFGLDVEYYLHDFWQLAQRAPRQTVIMPTGAFGEDSPELRRLLSGDWPAKRNIIITVKASSVEAGRNLLKKLRQSMPY